VVPFEPARWGLWTVFLYCLGAVYLAGFFVFVALFGAAARRVRRGGPPAAYNRLLKGFPNAFYAKMLGKRPL
jgi:hypothetical protein